MIAAALAASAASAALDLPAVTSPVEPHNTGGPHEILEHLSRELFSELGSNRSSFQSDPELVVVMVERLLTPHFDTPYAARLVLGAHWPDASIEDRRRFSLALFRSLLRLYAGSVADWTPERFKLLPFAGDPTALQAVVHTEVTTPGHALARVDYRLHKLDGAWLVFDVIVDGVSYMRSLHDDIDSEVSHAGLEATITRLERQTTRVAVMKSR